jgi:hypothetical protein
LPPSLTWKWGLKSLREAVGEPERVIGRGDTQPATRSLLANLNALRSLKFRRTILKRLDELGIERELVRRDWYDRVSQIATVQFADRVEGEYRFRGKQYRLEIDAGFDRETRAFWIKSGDRGDGASFFEAIAAQLVFKAVARPVHLLALERALQLEARDDPSFGHPENATQTTLQDFEMEGVVDEDDSQEAQPGEAVFGHSPFQPDPARNFPRSIPIPSASHTAATRQHHVPQKPGGKNESSDADSHSPSPELEREQIDNLKGHQYASHCQMCLCARSPKELAPPGSYVEWEEVRRRIVEAHHVDVKSGGGARHAGNLLLLCKLHHDNFGRRMSRESVTTALRAPVNETVVRFEALDGSVADLQGRLVKIAIPDTGEIVSVFFTQEHASYWLSNVPSR